MMAGVVADLRHAIGDDGVHDRPGELSLYRKDASNMEGAAGVVCFRATPSRCVVASTSPDVTRRRSRPAALAPVSPAARSRSTRRS
ncbi:MAG: hypothetical protein WKF58_13305 [Ilumatobacteraceae bacterium]